MIRHKNARVGHGIIAKQTHSRVIQRVVFSISNVWCQCIVLSTTIFSHDYTACHHVLMSLIIWHCISWISRIGGIASKVHTLAITGCIFPAKRSVETLLEDLVHNCDERNNKKDSIPGTRIKAK